MLVEPTRSCWSVRWSRCLVWLAVSSALDALPALAGTTLYVGKHFEVRDHDQPTKYVFNGAVRVARVTGSLSTNSRVQRLRVHPGWNLCTVAVEGSPLPRDGGNVTTAYRWNPAGGAWVPVGTNDLLAASSVLWLHAATNTVLALTGSYSDPTNRAIALGASFQPLPGLESLPLLGDGAAVGTDVDVWHHDAVAGTWRTRLPAIPGSDPAFPESLAPGGAVFAHTATPVTLEVPAAALRIRYYHQDHLSSSSLVTDGAGELVEEAAFYPFGVARNEHRTRQIEENYKFTQKERDKESGLHYFEARYLSGATARFIGVDPKYLHPEALAAGDFSGFLANPQELNLYGYARNNPVKFIDPTGHGVFGDIKDWVVDKVENDLWVPGRDSASDLDVGRTAKFAGGVALAIATGGGSLGVQVAGGLIAADMAGSAILGNESYLSQGLDVGCAGNQYCKVGGEMLITGGLGISAAGTVATKAPLPRVAPGSTPGLTPGNSSPAAFAKTVEVSPRAFGRTLPPVRTTMPGGFQGPASYGVDKEAWITAQLAGRNQMKLDVQMAGGNAFDEVVAPVFDKADELFGKDNLP